MCIKHDDDDDDDDEYIIKEQFRKKEQSACESKQPASWCLVSVEI